MWTDKYNPQHSSQIIGNKGAVDSLREWLSDWEDVVIKGNKKAVKTTFGNWADAPKPNARACLISGPPGIGKSTSALIIAKELGFEVL